MVKIGRPIKFVVRLTPEERTRLDGIIVHDSLQNTDYTSL